MLRPKQQHDEDEGHDQCDFGHLVVVLLNGPGQLLTRKVVAGPDPVDPKASRSLVVVHAVYLR